MKANEAPEKIYLEWYTIGDERRRDWCITPKTNDEPVEYTRTDAFINKALNWMDEHLFFDDKRWLVEEQKSVKEQMMEDFKNDMKE